MKRLAAILNQGQWKKEAGFTLTELLFAVAITSLVAVTVYAGFKTVVQSYEVNDSNVRIVENARAALGDLTNHLRAIPSASSPFIEMFAADTTPINTADLDTAAVLLATRGYSQDSIHFLAESDIDYWYFIDTTTNELMRNTSGTVAPIAFSVISANFLVFNRDTTSQEWFPKWDSTVDGLPKSIYIAITVKDDQNRQLPHTFTTLVSLP